MNVDQSWTLLQGRQLCVAVGGETDLWNLNSTPYLMDGATLLLSPVGLFRYGLITLRYTLWLELYFRARGYKCAL